jgi:hypothetical protein
VSAKLLDKANKALDVSNPGEDIPFLRFLMEKLGVTFPYVAIVPFCPYK